VEAAAHSSSTSRSPSPTVSPALQCTAFTCGTETEIIPHLPHRQGEINGLAAAACSVAPAGAARRPPWGSHALPRPPAQSPAEFRVALGTETPRPGGSLLDQIVSSSLRQGVLAATACWVSY